MMGQGINKRELPVNKNEDVEYSQELSDIEDKQANQRSKQADRRQENNRRS